MSSDLKTKTTIITARAICDGCEWNQDGSQAPTNAAEHVRQTGHLVSVNANSFTTIERKEQ